MELVEVKKDGIFCDSQMVARKFKQKHNHVTGVIEGLIDDFRGTQHSPKIIKEEREYRGRQFTAYLMDRKFFTMLAMRFKGKTAFEWQNKFVDAFFNMERQLLLEASHRDNERWLTQRAQGKVARLEMTDCVKEFIDYATVQGSANAKFYYKHVTTATYKALGLLAQKKPKLRDTLDLMELSYLQSAEFLVQRALRRYMEEGYPYKAIYRHLCDDLERYAQSLLLD